MMRPIVPAILLALIAALFVAAPSVQADLVMIGSTTVLDEDTGLYWLRVTETTGLSVSDIEAGAGGYAQAGWRHATVPEVCNLFESHLVPVFVPPEPCPSSVTDFPIFSTPASVQTWLFLFGDTAFDFGASDTGTNALLKTTSGGLRRGIVATGFNTVYAVQATSFGQDASDLHVGHFLVRETHPFAVPVTTGAGALVLTGILMLLAAVVLHERGRVGNQPT